MALQYEDGELTLEKVKRLLTAEKTVHFIYINYNKPNGIKIEKNQPVLDISLSDDDLSNYYRIYFFNNNCMIVFSKVDTSQYTVETVKKSDFFVCNEKEAYLKKDSNNTRFTKIGYVIGKKNEQDENEQFMYCDIN